MMEHDYDKFSQLSSAVRRPKKPSAKRTIAERASMKGAPLAHQTVGLEPGNQAS